MSPGYRNVRIQLGVGAKKLIAQFGGTVRWRLTLWYAVVLALAFAIFGVVVERIEARSLETEVDRQLLASLQTVTTVLSRSFVEDPHVTPDDLSDEINEFSLSPDTALLLELPGGRIFSRNVGGLSDTLLRAWEQSSSKMGIPWTGLNGGWRRRIVHFEGGPQSEFAGRVLLARDLSSVDAQLHSLRRLLVLVLSFVLLAAAAGGYWLSSRALRPVDQISARARHIEAHDLNQRLTVVRAGDEFGRLAQVLNDLFGRLERAFQQQRQFLADAAHELRTPVAVVRSQTDVALQQERTVPEYAHALKAIRKETEHLSAIVDDLLLIARADAAQLSVQRDLVDLVEIVDECCRSLRPLAYERKLNLDWAVRAELPIRADGRLLRHATANLLSNAINYTPESGSIHVDTRREPDSAVLEVTDTGIGIAPDELAQVFDRFYRAKRPDGLVGEGSGLGLAIVKMIAELHGGSIDVDSCPGAGSTFVLRIPLEPLGIETADERT